MEAAESLSTVIGPGPWPLAALRAAGWTDRQIRRAVDSGRLHRPHRGVVDLPSASSDLGRIRAALLMAGPRAAASHESAARVHGLWLPHPASDLVHLTEPGRPDRTDHGVRIHGSRLSTPHVVTVQGIPATSLPRTAIDLARGRALPEAMVVVDSAAREIIRRSTGRDLRLLRDPATRAELREVALAALQDAFAEVWTWPGTVVARAAIELVEPACESPLESRSRGWFHEARLPAPRIAWHVRGASGAWYVADFAWPARRLLGEADGIAKYGRDPTTVASSLRAERRRQRDLEDIGWRFARWDSSEAPRTVVARVARALADPA